MAKLKRLTPEELVLKTVVAPTGERGPKGDKGEKGDRGNDGSIGPAGLSGLAGSQGLQGTRGTEGREGIPGVSGQSGSTGPEGPQGPVPEFQVEGTQLKVKNSDGEFEELADLKLSEPPIRGPGGAGGGSIIRPADNNVMVKVTNITSDFVASIKDQVIIADATSGAITVTLPKVERALNREIMVKRINKGGNKVTILPVAPDTIDRETSVDITGQHDCITLCSNQPNDWWIL